MSKKSELTENLDTAIESLKDYDKFLHLFSKDEGVKTLATLRKTLGQIRVHLGIATIKEIIAPVTKPLRPNMRCGPILVRVRPCGEKYQGKTWLGFLLGDLALASQIEIKADRLVCEFAFFNPAIYIPSTGDTVMGCESWWSEITDLGDLSDIEDADIENTWYVKALKSTIDKPLLATP